MQLSVENYKLALESRECCVRDECVWLQLRSHICFMSEIERIKTADSENYEYDRKLKLNATALIRFTHWPATIGRAPASSSSRTSNDARAKIPREKFCGSVSPWAPLFQWLKRKMNWLQNAGAKSAFDPMPVWVRMQRMNYIYSFGVFWRWCACFSSIHWHPK